MFDRVVAFEPDAVNRECLLSNIERHELDNITVVANAMSATTGSARFWVDGSLGSRLALPEYTRGRFENIETTSLVDACIKYGIPELICMDIESAEIEVLDAARDLLKQQSIIFSIDTNHDEVHGWTFGRVEEILRSCGYQVETGMPGGFYTTWGWK